MDRKITFDDYRGIIRALRDPEKGCPWDKAQTHESLKPCMIHEMTEAVAAVNLLSDTGDADNLSEELGDVLLQVVLQSQIAEEEGLFSLDDVIQKVNSMPHPLALYFFTKNKAAAKKITASCGFGGGCINDTIIHLATSEMSFGGFGESGMGGYHGKEGFCTFSHFKSIVDKKTWLDLPMRYQPYKKLNNKLIHFFLK